jgi:hypothetical protein
MPQTRLWNDPSHPRLDELPPDTRRRILLALARMIRHQIAHQRARAGPNSDGRTQRPGHD